MFRPMVFNLFVAIDPFEDFVDAMYLQVNIRQIVVITYLKKGLTHRYVWCLFTSVILAITA